MVKRTRRPILALVARPPYPYKIAQGIDLTQLGFIAAKKYQTRPRRSFVVNNRLIKLHGVPKPYLAAKQQPFDQLVFNQFSVTQRTRPHGIKIRLSEAERYQLQQKAQAARMSVASYMRQSALDTKLPKQRTPPKLDPVFLRQYAGACNNLNQLVHQLHIKNNSGEDFNTLVLADAIQQLSHQLQQIYAQLLASNNPADC